MGRFISADAIVSTGQGILGNNMIAYCRNNPVCRKDISGMVDMDCFDEVDDEIDVTPGEDDIGYSSGGSGQQGFHSNGLYENAAYHTPRGNSVKSPSPTNGQSALDNSVQVKSTSPTRIGISNNQFVVLMQHRPGLYHGHVREWGELTQDMQNALIRNGFVSWKGRIL